MELIKLVEDSCEHAYSTCESIDVVVKNTRCINDVLEDICEYEQYPKCTQSAIKSIYDELLGLEIEYDRIQSKACEVLKRYDKLLARLERQSDNIQEIDVTR